MAVYILHFVDQLGKSTRYKHAGHYCGYTQDLDQRLAEHRRGRGARLIEVILKAGLTFKVSHVWKDGTRKFERQLKNRGSLYRSCPICQQEKKNEIFTNSN